MNVEAVVFVAIMWGCAALFALIAIYMFKCKGLMRIFAGRILRPREISDMPAYNRANGKVSIAASLFCFLCGVLGFLDLDLNIVGIALAIVCVFGVLVLAVVTIHIDSKYRK